MTKPTTYLVHAYLGQMFEDVSVTARSPEEAIEKARKALKGTRLDHRFTNYVV